MKKLLFLLILVASVTAKANSQSFLFLVAASGTTPPAPGTSIIDSLAKITVSGVSTLDINMSGYVGNYTKIFIRIDVTTNNGSAIQVQLSANGTAFDNGAGAYQWWDNYGGAVNSPSDTCISLLGALGTGARLTGEIQIEDPNNASKNPQITTFVAGKGTQMYNAMSSGIRLTNQVTKGVRIRFLGSSTITGSAWVYGMH
jgi:hypothetical protein